MRFSRVAWGVLGFSRGSFRGAGDGPVVAIDLDEFAASGEASELLGEKTTLFAAAETEFADELLVTGFFAGRASDAAEEFGIGHGLRIQGMRDKGTKPPQQASVLAGGPRQGLRDTGTRCCEPSRLLFNRF